MSVRDYFSRFFPASFFGSLASGFCLRLQNNHGLPGRPTDFTPVLFRLVRFQGEGPILYIVFLALDFSFFTSGLAFFAVAFVFRLRSRLFGPLGRHP